MFIFLSKKETSSFNREIAEMAEGAESIGCDASI